MGTTRNGSHSGIVEMRRKDCMNCPDQFLQVQQYYSFKRAPWEEKILEYLILFSFAFLNKKCLHFVSKENSHRALESLNA